MYPRSFDYEAPTSLENAASILDSNPDAKIMAGGQSLLPLMKMRLLSPGTVVDIGQIDGLDGIDDRGETIAIGALVRHGTTAGNTTLEAHARALTEAASFTGDAQVRNRGTTCGSMAHADIAADQPAAALALAATMVAQSTRGIREIPSADFFVDTLTTALEPDEILVEIRIPKTGGGSAYDKLGRRGGHSDYAVAGAAAWIERSNGSIGNARIAVTGIGTKPALALGSMEELIGSDGSDEAINAAAARATEDVTLLEDLYGSEEYKAHLAKVFVARAVKTALSRG